MSSFNVPCDICSQARQAKLPFYSSNITTKFIFELIYIDTWGPYKIDTNEGYRYLLTIMDDYSRGTWTYLLRTKSNAFSVLQSFLVLIERQFNTKFKVIRSDNALELGTGITASKILSFQGILHQTSCVSTPQQNGVVEQKHKHLLETCRALLFQSKLPIEYWGDCLLTTTFLINRFPSRVLKFKSPYEILFEKDPSYDFLKCFGCLC